MFCRRPFTAFVIATLALGCADLRDLLSLQQGLTREFNEAGVGVNINNNVSLTVTFSNSSAAGLSDPERAAFARRVAEYVRDHYARYESLQAISVGFAAVTKAGPVKYTERTVPYRFTPGDLGPAKVSAQKITTNAP